MEPDRRWFLLGLLGATAGAVSACSSAAAPAGPSRTLTPTAGVTGPGTSAFTTVAASPSPSPSVALPATTPWTPGPGELQPDVKLRAAQVVEALAAWPSGGAGRGGAQARLSALGVDPGLADQATTLWDNGAAQAACQVIFAQYAGILSDTANVMVIMRQWLQQPNAAITPAGTTVQVLLDAASPRWRPTGIVPAVLPPAAATPPPAAAAVLANSRIHLAPAAEADVRSGTISTHVLTALTELAASHVLDVDVIRSGHPLDVVGTTRRSDHPLGRAVDIRAIDGHLVVDPATPKDLVVSFMEAGRAAGAYQVGGPYQLYAPGFDYFSDDSHHDHVHLGFAS